MSLAAFLVLWVSLGLWVQWRSEASDFAKASNTETEWGFGHILAVVASLPMVMELFRIWACERTLPSQVGHFSNPIL